MSNQSLHRTVAKRRSFHAPGFYHVKAVLSFPLLIANTFILSSSSNSGILRCRNCSSPRDVFNRGILGLILCFASVDMCADKVNFAGTWVIDIRPESERNAECGHADFTFR